MGGGEAGFSSVLDELTPVLGGRVSLGSAERFRQRADIEERPHSECGGCWSPEGLTIEGEAVEGFGVRAYLRWEFERAYIPPLSLPPALPCPPVNDHQITVCFSFLLSPLIRACCLLVVRGTGFNAFFKKYFIYLFLNKSEGERKKGRET